MFHCIRDPPSLPSQNEEKKMDLGKGPHLLLGHRDFYTFKNLEGQEIERSTTIPKTLDEAGGRTEAPHTLS